MVSLEAVTKVFNPGEVNEVVAVSNLSLNVAEGEFLVVIGGNGSGKSTLLNLVAGSLLPDSGKVVIAGRDLTKTPDFRRAALIGRVFQDPLIGTSAGLTIEENFALAASRGDFRGLSPALNRVLRDNIRDRLTVLGMGLEDRLKTKVGLLSGGQRQAVTILMAVFKRPRVLLLDEHTAALDPRSSRKIVELTHDIVDRQALTTLMITHNLNHVSETGRRTIMLSRGVVAHDLDTDRVRQMNGRELLGLYWDTQAEEEASSEVLG